MQRIIFLMLLFASCAPSMQHPDNNTAQHIEQLEQRYKQLRNAYPDSTESIVDSIITVSKRNNYDKGLALGKLLQAVEANNDGAYELALNASEQAMTIARKHHEDSLIAMAYSVAGLSHWHKGKYSDALQYHFQALKIRERLHHERDAASAKANIGLVYQYQGKLEEATKWVTEAMKTYESDTPTANYAKIVHTLANIHGMQGNYKYALALDEKGLAICDSINAPYLKSMFFANMANCQLAMKNYDAALVYFNRSLDIDTLSGNKRQAAASYLNIAGLHLERERYADASTLLQKSIALSKEIGSNAGLYDSYQKLAETYAAQGNYADAYNALSAAGQAKDSVINLSSEQKIAELQTLYESGKKEQQIQEQAFTIRQRDYLIVSISVGTILAALLAFSFYRRRKLKQEKQHQQSLAAVERKNAEDILAAEENERKRVALDLHDGVGQMMTAAKMNLHSYRDTAISVDSNVGNLLEKSLQLLSDSCEEIRSISHNMMPNSMTQSGLIKALQLFISNASSEKLSIVLYSDWQHGKIDLNREAVLYRIIQEAINNVAKHAQASSVQVHLSNEDDITCTIEDNGKGFDYAVAAVRDGIGLKNIQARVAFLKGTVEWDSAVGKGTAITIHIPVEA